MHGIRIRPWRISPVFCDLVRFRFAMIDVNAFEPEMVIIVVSNRAICIYVVMYVHAAGRT